MMENEKKSPQVQPNFDKWVIKYNDIVEDGAIRYDSLLSIPTLQFISSVHLVVPLWYNKLRMLKRAPTYSQVFKIADEINNELDDIVKAKPLHQYLPQLIIHISEELSRWIKVHDGFVFKKNKKEESVAINYIDKIVWSPRGTINYLKTAKSLLEVKKSIVENNYVIVCAKCCASEETLIGYISFYDWDMLEYIWLNLMHRSLKNWEELKANACVYCFNREFSAYLKNSPVSDSVKLDYHYRFFLDFSCNIVSKLNTNQQNDSMDFSEHVDQIIMQFLMNHLYHDYLLPTIYHTRNCLSGSCVHKILYHLNGQICDHHHSTSKYYSYLYEKYVFFFREIWSFLPADWKNYVLDSGRPPFDWIWENSLLHLLPAYFADCNMDIKRRLMLGAECINFCKHLIMNDQYEMFEKYVCPVFFAGNTEESHYLKKLFVRNVIDVFWYFIKARNWSALDKLFIWSYSSETERMKRKKMLLRDIYVYEVDDYAFTLETQRPYQSENNCKPMNGVTNLDHLDELLKYCFDSKIEIDKFKITEFCKTYNFNQMICDMKKCKRPDLIQHFLSWCFSNNKKLIRRFEMNFSKGLCLGSVDEPRLSKRRRHL